VRSLVAAGDDAAAGALLSDDVLDRFAFSGSPDRIAAHAEEVLEAGAGRVDFGTPHGIPEQRGVELLCREVLPRLRATLAADR
jgi:5,10-methylenetetrahydromethanopterin reductase